MTPSQQPPPPAPADPPLSEHPFALPNAGNDRLGELGTLAAALVHELKNPLGAISLNTELLLSAVAAGSTDQERTLTRLRRVQAGVHQLQAVISAFLGFARPGRPDRERVDLNRLVEEVLDEQGEVLERAAIEVTFHPTQDLLAVPADKAQLRAVLLNIILNARDALMERPRDRRLVILSRNGHDGIRLVIANNGPPVPDAIAARLFTPFASGKENGTGLGLAIVARLVELHHGTVTVASDPDQGVSFTIELPTTLGPARPRPELPPPAEPTPRDDAGDATVMATDDTPSPAPATPPTDAPRGAGT